MLRMTVNVLKNRKLNSRVRSRALRALDLASSVKVNTAAFHASQAVHGFPFFNKALEKIKEFNKPDPLTLLDSRYPGPTTGWTAKVEDVPFEINPKALPAGVKIPHGLSITRHIAWNDLYPFTRGSCKTLEALYAWMQAYQQRLDDQGVIYGLAPFPENFSAATKRVASLEAIRENALNPNLSSFFKNPVDKFNGENEIVLVFNLDAVKANKANIKDRVSFVIEATEENIKNAIAGKDVINLLNGQPFNYRQWFIAQTALTEKYGYQQSNDLYSTVNESIKPPKQSL